MAAPIEITKQGRSFPFSFPYTVFVPRDHRGYPFGYVAGVAETLWGARRIAAREARRRQVAKPRRYVVETVERV